jgi:hypothetical protein
VNFPQKKGSVPKLLPKKNQERTFLKGKKKKKKKKTPKKKKFKRRKRRKKKKKKKSAQKSSIPEPLKRKHKEKRKRKSRNKKNPPQPHPPNGNENLAARSPTPHTKLQNRATPLRWNCHPFCRTASRAIELAIIGRAVVISRPSLPARHRPFAVPSVPVATTTRSLFRR